MFLGGLWDPVQLVHSNVHRFNIMLYRYKVGLFSVDLFITRNSYNPAIMLFKVAPIFESVNMTIKIFLDVHFQSVTQASDKNIWRSPNGSRTYDLGTTSSDLLPLSYGRLLGASMGQSVGRNRIFIFRVCLWH